MALRNQEIGERITQLREKRGLPQTAVANAIGAGERTYQGWERGEAKPRYRFLERLAEYFGVSEGYILTGISAVETPDPFQLSDQIETVEKAFRKDVDLIRTNLVKIDERLAGIDGRLDRIEATIASLAPVAKQERQDIADQIGRVTEIVRDLAADAALIGQAAEAVRTLPEWTAGPRASEPRPQGETQAN